MHVYEGVHVDPGQEFITQTFSPDCRKRFTQSVCMSFGCMLFRVVVQVVAACWMGN